GPLPPRDQLPAAWVPRPEEYQRPTSWAPPPAGAPRAPSNLPKIAGVLLIVSAVVGMSGAIYNAVTLPSVAEYTNFTQGNSPTTVALLQICGRISIATIPARSAGESGVLSTYPASERRSMTSVTSSEVLFRSRSTPISRTMSRPAFAAYTAAFAVVPSSNRRAPSWNSNTFGSKSNMRSFPNQPAIVGRSVPAKDPRT